MLILMVKKCNFKKHLTHKNHKNTALRLKEASISKSAPAVSTTKEVPRGAVKQTLLCPMIQKNIGGTMFAARMKISVSSLQMAIHLSCMKISESLKKTIYHGVDLDTGFLTDKGGAEIMKYMNISQRIKNITEKILLTKNILNHYSVQFDGTSSSKCVDEKEVFLIKLCVEGKPVFHVISFEEPKECNT